MDLNIMSMPKQTYRRTRYRIKSKVRFCLFVTLLTLLLIFIISLALLDGKAMTPINYKRVYVYDGDTLWSIAGRYLPKGVDIRAFIDEIKITNDMSDPLLYVGQELSVPIYPTSKELVESKDIALME